MTFSFNAIGAKEEVTAQIEAAPINDNVLGEAAKKLIIEALGLEKAVASPNYEYRYVVSVSGHSGGSFPIALNLVIQSHYVPVIKI